MNTSGAWAALLGMAWGALVGVLPLFYCLRSRRRGTLLLTACGGGVVAWLLTGLVRADRLSEWDVLFFWIARPWIVVYGAIMALATVEAFSGGGAPGAVPERWIVGALWAIAVAVVLVALADRHMGVGFLLLMMPLTFAASLLFARSPR